MPPKSEEYTYEDLVGHYRLIPRHSWCIIQKCQYSDPIVVRCVYVGKQDIRVIEYSYGELSYTVNMHQILKFGTLKGLMSSLGDYLDIKKAVDEAKKQMEELSQNKD